MEQVDYVVARLVWAAVYVTVLSKFGSQQEQFAIDAAEQAFRTYTARFKKKEA